MEKQAHPFVHLELLRGFTALMVVFHHVRVTLFGYFDSFPAALQSWIVKSYLFLGGFNRGPVLVFFVLSGFLIIRKIWGEHDTWSTRAYAADRLSRLWAVLFPSLLLTFCTIEIGRMLWHEYTGAIGYLLAPSEIHVGLKYFAGNAFFLQRLVVPIFGDNAPLWSLSYEFWYYVLFPLILFATLGKGRRRVWSFAGAVVVAIGIIYLNSDVLALFACWLIGGVAVVIERSKFFRIRRLGRGGLLLAYLMLVGALVVHRWARVESLFADYLFCLIVAICIGLSVTAVSFQMPRRLEAVAKFLSLRSYTTYLMHNSIIGLLFYLVFSGYKVLPTYGNLAIALCIFTAALGCTWLLYLPFERNTPVVKRWMYRWLRVPEKKVVTA